MEKDYKRRLPVHKDNIRTWEVKVDNDTLLNFVSFILKDHTKTKIKSMLKHNQFAINSMPTTRFDAPLYRGGKVSINFDKSFKVFSHPRVRLVYEDDDILVINKGYGILSMGTDKIKDGTAYSIMREYVKYADPSNKVFIVHRLDRDTSGLMMLAKSMAAKDSMQHNWHNMVLSRQYITVGEGVVEKEADTIKSYIAEKTKFKVYST